MAQQTFERQNIGIQGGVVTPASPIQTAAQVESEIATPILNQKVRTEEYQAGFAGHQAAMNGDQPNFDIEKPRAGSQMQYAQSYLAALSAKTQAGWQDQVNQSLSTIQASPDRNAAYAQERIKLASYVTNSGANLQPVATRQVQSQLALNMEGFDGRAQGLVAQQNTKKLQYAFLENQNAMMQGAFNIGTSNNGSAATEATQRFQQQVNYGVSTGLMTPQQGASTLKAWRFKLNQGAFYSQYSQAQTPDDKRSILDKAVETDGDNQEWYHSQAIKIDRSKRAQQNINADAIKSKTADLTNTIYNNPNDPQIGIEQQQVNGLETAEGADKTNKQIAAHQKMANSLQYATTNNPNYSLPNLLNQLKTPQALTSYQAQAHSRGASEATKLIAQLKGDPAQFVTDKLLPPSYTTSAQYDKYQQWATDPFVNTQKNSGLIQQHCQTMIATAKGDNLTPDQWQCVSNKETSNIATQLNPMLQSTDPQQRQAGINNLANLVSSYGQYAPQLVDQLYKQGVNPTALMWMKNYPANAALMPQLSNMMMDSKNLATQYKSRLSNDGLTNDAMTTAVNSNKTMRTYLDSFGGAAGRGHDISIDIKGVTDYAQYLYASGQAKNIESAVDDSVNFLVKSNYSHIDGDIRIPKKYGVSNYQLKHIVLPLQNDRINQLISKNQLKKQYSVDAPAASDILSQKYNADTFHWVSMNDDTLAAVDQNGAYLETKPDKNGQSHNFIVQLNDIHQYMPTTDSEKAAYFMRMVGLPTATKASPVDSAINPELEELGLKPISRKKNG